jgi:hypothetical protein
MNLGKKVTESPKASSQKIKRTPPEQRLTAKETAWALKKPKISPLGAGLLFKGWAWQFYKD